MFNRGPRFYVVTGGTDERGPEAPNFTHVRHVRDWARCGSIITLPRQTSKNFSPPLSRFPRLSPRPLRVRRLSLAALLTSLQGVGHSLGTDAEETEGGSRNQTRRERARLPNEMGGTDHAGGQARSPIHPLASHLCVSRTKYDLSVCPSVRRSVVSYHCTAATMAAKPAMASRNTGERARLAVHTPHLCLSRSERNNLPQNRR